MAQDETNKLPPEIVQALAEQLRDVHLPEAVSWWPLAWGWWVLLIAIVCGLGLSAWLIRRSIAKNYYRALAINELESNFQLWRNEENNSAYLQAANTTLKRAILHTSKQASLITISGTEWIGLLNEWSGEPLSNQSQSALAYECYQANSQTDINVVHAELIRWLKNHKRPLNSQDTNQRNSSQAKAKRGQHA